MAKKKAEPAAPDTRPPARYSELRLFKESIPRYYKTVVTKEWEWDDPTKKMTFGSVVDCLLFTPDDLERRFLFHQKWDARTNEGKAARAKAQDEAALMTPPEGFRAVELLPYEDLDRAEKVAKVVRSHPIAGAMLKGKGTFQTKLRWGHPLLEPDGHSQYYPCTGSPDSIRFPADGDELPIVWDLKVVDDLPGESKYHFKVLDFDYHLQCGSYLYGLRYDPVFRHLAEGQKHLPLFRHVCAQSTWPYEIKVFDFGDRLVDRGMEEFDTLVNELAIRVRNNDWSSRHESQQYEVELPSYLR